jgi:hypothetical protein
MEAGVRSRWPRLLALPLAVFAGLVVIASPSAEGAARCPAGQVEWQLDAKRACLPRAQFAPAPVRGKARGVLPALLALSIDEAAGEPVLETGVGARHNELGPRVIATLRRAFAQLYGAATKGARVPAAVRTGADRLPTVTLDAGNGVTVTGSGTRSEGPGEGRVGNGASDFTIAVGKQEGDVSAEFKTSFGDSSWVRRCPSAEGEVPGVIEDSVRITLSAKVGDESASVDTLRQQMRARVDGQVGPDARLDYFDVEVVDESSVVGKGGRITWTTRIRARVDAAAARRGAAGSYSDFAGRTDSELDVSDDVTVDRAELARVTAEKRAALFARIVEKASDLFDAAEKDWYEGKCTEIRWRPEPGFKVRPGQRIPIEGSLRTNDGIRVAARWQITEGPYQGTVSPRSARSEPFVPARLVFTVAARLARNRSIGFVSAATSRAGRSLRGWSVDARKKDEEKKRKKPPPPSGSPGFYHYALRGGSLTVKTHQISTPKGSRYEGESTLVLQAVVDPKRMSVGSLPLRFSTDGILALPFRASVRWQETLDIERVGTRRCTGSKVLGTFLIGVGLKRTGQLVRLNWLIPSGVGLGNEDCGSGDNFDDAVDTDVRTVSYMGKPRVLLVTSGNAARSKNVTTENVSWSGTVTLSPDAAISG